MFVIKSRHRGHVVHEQIIGSKSDKHDCGLKSTRAFSVTNLT